MPRPDSVRRTAPIAAPLRHPYYLSPRAEQRIAAREELCAFLDEMAAARARLAGRRVLMAVAS